MNSAICEYTNKTTSTNVRLIFDEKKNMKPESFGPQSKTVNPYEF